MSYSLKSDSNKRPGQGQSQGQSKRRNEDRGDRSRSGSTSYRRWPFHIFYGPNLQNYRIIGGHIDWTSTSNWLIRFFTRFARYSYIYTGTDLSALNSTTGGSHNIPRDKAAIIFGPLWLMGIPQDAFITICLDRVVNDLETKFHIFNLLVYGMELFHYLNYDGIAEAS